MKFEGNKEAYLVITQTEIRLGYQGCSTLHEKKNGLLTTVG